MRVACGCGDLCLRCVDVCGVCVLARACVLRAHACGACVVESESTKRTCPLHRRGLRALHVAVGNRNDGRVQNRLSCIPHGRGRADVVIVVEVGGGEQRGSGVFRCGVSRVHLHLVTCLPNGLALSGRSAAPLCIQAVGVVGHDGPGCIVTDAVEVKAPRVDHGPQHRCRVLHCERVAKR